MVPTAENHDVVIIGGGPAGYAAALYGASAGLDIAMVEKAKVGGTCLHVGCIPAKELLETAAVRRAIEGSARFGLTTTEPLLDFSVTQQRKQQVIDQLFSGLTGLFKRRKVTIYDGVGTPARRPPRPGQRRKLRRRRARAATHVLLASGSVPRTIPGFEVDGSLVITSDELLSLQKLPASAVVIGGGAIGCEFASMMADLGTKVTILEALPKILPGCDDDIDPGGANVLQEPGHRPSAPG